MVLTNGGCVHCAAARANGEEWCPDCDAELFSSAHGRAEVDDADGTRAGVSYTPPMVRQ